MSFLRYVQESLPVTHIDPTIPCLKTCISLIILTQHYSDLISNTSTSFLHERPSKAKAVLSRKELNSLTCFKMPPSGLLLLTSPAMVLSRIERSGSAGSPAAPPAGVFSSPRETASSISWREVERAACS